MRFTLNMESNNQAFTDDEHPFDLVVGQLIAKVGLRVDDGELCGMVIDPVNGQAVGTWTYQRGETD